jgi:hypothetical protein
MESEPRLPPGFVGAFGFSQPERFMRKLLLALLAGAAAGLTASPVAAQDGGKRGRAGGEEGARFQQGRRGRGLSPQGAGRFGWLSSYREAKELAGQTGKPLMLVFRCVP